MNLKEGLSVRITPAPKKQRKIPGYWNWPELIALAEKALKTGEEQRGRVDGTFFAVAIPDYGIVKESRTPEYLALHEKVRIVLFHLAFTLSAEKGETTPCPHVRVHKTKALIMDTMIPDDRKELKYGK